MKKYALIVLLSISLTTNVGLLYLYKTAPTEAQLQKTQQQFPLVNPGSVHVDPNIQPQNLILHYQKLKPLVLAEIATGASGAQVGVFLQDVKTGAWMGINEQEGFIPASLLKVPLMMAMLKKVERGEVKLSDTIEITADDLNDWAGDLYKKGAGARLTVWDLLKQMILSSDNTAKNAIHRQLLPVEINAVFEHVGIENPYDDNTDHEVTPRGFSRIFKSLYLASFLTPELSQRALDLTTDTQVEQLISAGVPPEIQVAHKYGEKPDSLSDCGIIYHPKNPYYLCIMTKDFDPMAEKKMISNISQIIYTYIDGQ